MNVVSTTLFFECERYMAYLPVAVRAHHNMYRGWSFRIHHDRSFDRSSYARELRLLAEHELVELVLVDEVVLKDRALLWRLLPLWDDRVERFLCRDINTIPSFRERCVVEEWIRSDLAFHAVSDKRWAHDFQTFGGMIGFRTKQARSLLSTRSFDELLSRAKWADCDWAAQTRKSSFTTNERLFLLEQIWPLMQESTYEHRLSGSCVFAGTNVSKQEITITDVVEVSKSIRKESDIFTPFIGSSDIDIDRALDFYKQYGDPEIEKVISKCERSSGKGSSKKSSRAVTAAPVVPDARATAQTSSVRILVRMPTRSRPEQALRVLAAYRDMAGRPIQIEVVIDKDDASMKNTDVLRQLALLGCTVTVGKHKSKVEAVNGGRVTDWDVLILASDDMVPIVDGWALRVEHDMLLYFPHLDGALHYNDGNVGDKLCTIPVMGRRLYRQFNAVYNKEYQSLWCDNEQTEVLQKMKRLQYIPECIIEHRHYINRKSQRDDLYIRNEALNGVDRLVYFNRKERNFDMPPMRLSILIASLPARSAKLNQLLENIWAQAFKHPLQVEVLVDTDEGTTGAKRQRLLEKALGEFIAYVDDDDKLSGDYVDRILGAIAKLPMADCVEFHVSTLLYGKMHVGHCSNKYRDWATVNDVHVRCPNHLNPVRREHALKAGFPDKTIGEDYAYSMRLLPYLKTEAPLSPEPLYFYYPGGGK